MILQLTYCVDATTFVLHSAKTLDRNHHIDNVSQRYAIDFVSVPKEGRRFSADGALNSDFSIFGRDVYAPCDGVVAFAVDGVPDNIPGELNSYMAFGNVIGITCEKGFVVFIAHLHNASVRVKQGQRISEGQLIAACGNSGRSSEPHLHVHVQNCASFSHGIGIPFVLKGAVCNGVSMERCDPLRGDILAPLDTHSRDAKPVKQSTSIFYFDDNCTFCRRFVSFLKARSINKNLLFEPIGGASFVEEAIVPPVNRASLVEGDKLYEGSEAVLRALVALGGAYTLFRIFELVPSFLQQRVYDFIASHRNCGSTCKL